MYKENTNRMSVREQKTPVRRKLAPLKVNNGKLLCSQPKKVRNSKAGKDELDTELKSDELKRAVSGSEVDAGDHSGSSQEMASQSTTSLPRVTWEGQRVTSPIVSQGEGSNDADTFSSVKVDLPQTKVANASSTPYLKKIWKESKARRQSLSSASSSRSAYSDSKQKGHVGFLNQMYSLVSELEKDNSQASLTDSSAQSEAPTQDYTQLVERAVTPQRPEARNSSLSRRRQLAITPTLSKSYSRPDANDSALSDSLEEFSADFLLSDSDESSWVESSFSKSRVGAPAATDVSLSTKSQSDTSAVRNVPDRAGEYDSSKYQTTVGNTDSCSDLSVKKESGNKVKLEPSTPETKAEKLQSMRSEATTPTNPTGKLRKGSPVTPLRRYSSHDSAIKSPVTKPTSKQNSSVSDEKKTLNLIEEKRRQALHKLNSRKGSLTKHKSLDSVTSASFTDSIVTTATPTSSTALQQLIDEKRKLAAEKLQKHREEGRDRSDSLSGTIRQLTPPSSQENLSNPNSGVSTFSQPDSSKRLSQSSRLSGQQLLDDILGDTTPNTKVKAKSTLFSQNKSDSALNSKTMSKVKSEPNSVPTPPASISTVKPRADNSNRIKPKQGCQTLDEKTRLIIEEKRQAAIKKLRQSKQLGSS